MADNIEWDTSDFEAKAAAAIMRVKQNTLTAVNDVATTILALSQVEVPLHSTSDNPRRGSEGSGGNLQNSGHVSQAKNIEDPEAIVGYNTPYAAYQHEGHRKDGSHVITRHSVFGRKTKFLEDPIRHNLDVFRKYFLKLLN